MRPIYRAIALVLILIMLVGCGVTVTPTESTTPAPATATPVATATAEGATEAPATAEPEATATPVAIDMSISDLRFSSDPGSPNAREELVKKYPEFAKDHTAKVVCFEMGWTGPIKEQDFLTPEIAKRTGFNMVYEPMTTNSEEELTTKLNLMVTSGEVPEIFFGSSNAYSLDVYEKLGQANLIYDMAPYLTKYSGIETLLKPELVKYRRTDDAGTHNWFVPTQTGRGNDLIHNATSGLFLRKDFLEILKMDYPTTMDELHTYFKRCRDEIKTINGKPIQPMVFEEDAGSYWNIINCFMPMERSGFGFDWENNFKPYNYQYTNSPELIKGMTYLNMLYSEGLIDKETISMKREQISQKITTGRATAITASWWDMNTFSDIAKTEVPELMYVISKPLKDKDIPIKNRKWTNWVGMYSTLTFSTKMDEETIQHFVAMLDYMVDLDGQMLTQAGLPGKSFELDANGKYKFTNAFKKETADLDWNKVAATGVYYWSQLVFNLPAFESMRAEYPELVRKDNYESWLHREDSRALYDPAMMPSKDYYFDAGPIEREKMTALSDAFRKLTTDCIMAKNAAGVEKLVNAYAVKCKELGVEEIMAERQQIIDKIDISSK